MKPAGQAATRAKHYWNIMLVGGLLVQWSLVPCLGRAKSELPYNVRIWQTDDGLPHNSVWALAHAPDGYLWVGTQQGLARFDGVRFTPVDTPEAPELKQGWITALCVSRKGALWIGCDGQGLFCFEQGHFRRVSEQGGLPGNQPRCLFEDTEGALWVGTETGLGRLADGKFTNYTVQEGLGDNGVRAVCEDRERVIWAATKRGLSRLGKDGKFTTVTFPGGWNANALRAVIPDRRGQLWVGSTDGLINYQQGQPKLIGAHQGLPDKIVNCIFEDHAGQLWVATYGGLAEVVDEQVISWPNSEAVFGDLVYTIMEDGENTLWVGARDGLFRLVPARFVTYTTQHGLPANNVMSVLEDHSGTVWLGTWGGGLAALRGGDATTYSLTNGPARDSVLSICETRETNLWLGMDFDLGLERVAGNARVPVARQPGLINAAIRVIREDNRGRLWIGTSRGLNLLAEGICQVYTPTNGLPSETVMDVCVESAESVWVGTDGGLAHWHNGQLERFTGGEMPSHEVINGLYLDADKTLWIGTRGNGLGRWQGGKLRWFTSRDGLFSDEIYEIVEDDFGYFWMSCRRGLFRVRKQEFTELSSGQRRLLRCVSFGKADGLQSVQFNGVAKPAGWKAKDGRLWFPSIRGAVAVQPRLATNEKPPPVAVEGVIADGKPVAEAPFSQRVKVGAGRRNLQIHYTALSLQAPEKNRFKYMLEGVDPAWIDAGGQRVVQYNNLAPGSYRFRVMACNNDGVWNEEGAALAFIVQPRFWQTWWFKAVMAALLAMVLAGLYHIRVARLKEIERLRLEIAENLHDDVGARLTKVGMIAESLDQETREGDPLKQPIRVVFNTTRDIIQAMDEIVWTINPKNDTLEHLANYVFQYAQEYFQDTSVRCRIDMPAQMPEISVSTEVRHNLFMAAKEALTNVLKHAGATQVHLRLSAVEERLRIEIQDNGGGFDQGQANRSGNGLQNMKDRLERVGGSFSLRSRPGAGTTVVLETKGS